MAPRSGSALRAERPLPASMTGGQAVWETLARLGVTHVFGYPGGAILPTYDALPGARLTHVLARHEQSAAHMADGFARATGRVGVAVATSGPGATNLVTGIATAMADGSPIVCITGQVSAHLLGSDAFQEVDITGITMPITKHNYLVTDSSRIAPCIWEAFRIAASGRPGPVLVDITRDAQHAACTVDWDGLARPARTLQALPAVDRASCQAALDAIAAARRPIVLAGHGVLSSGASRLLRAFVDRTGIPVATTLLGIGAVPGSHPLNLGLFGLHGHAVANRAVQNADLVLALGVRFGDRATGDVNGFAPRARRVHVEIDPAEINKTVRADVAIVGDAGDVLRVLLPRVAAGDYAEWLAAIRAWRNRDSARDILNLPADGRLHAAHVMHALSRETRGKSVVVTDVGQHQMWEAQYYRHERPRSLITSGGLGTMGFALPAAIGARVARPDAEVWVVAGDGGFQMTAAELATVVQERLPLRIAVINNGYLGMVRQLQEVYCGKRYSATPLSGPDFCRLAEAYGIAAQRVESPADVVPAIKAARRHDGPILVEFRVEREDSVYPMVPAGATLDQMRLQPLPGPRRIGDGPRGA